MKFPVTIRHRSAKVKIYGPTKHFDYYRLASTVAGRRRMQTFANYSDARAAAQSIAREIAAGSEATALSARQSRDAVAALERLDAFHQATGRKVSLLGAVSEFCEAADARRPATAGRPAHRAGVSPDSAGPLHCGPGRRGIVKTPSLCSWLCRADTHLGSD